MDKNDWMIVAIIFVVLFLFALSACVYLCYLRQRQSHNFAANFVPEPPTDKDGVPSRIGQQQTWQVASGTYI